MALRVVLEFVQDVSLFRNPLKQVLHSETKYTSNSKTKTQQEHRMRVPTLDCSCF